MRFFIVKHEQVCRACGSIMMPGEEAVALLVYNNIPLTFHIECFSEWNKTMFNHRLEYWRQSRGGNDRKVKPKMGRPRKYIDPIKAGRLRSLKLYYLKRGNNNKVSELQVMLSDLRA